MRELIKRFKLPTPLFWRRVSNLGISIGTACTVGFNIPNIPNWFEEITQQGIGIGFALAMVARLAVYDKDKPLLSNDDLKQRGENT